MEGVWKRRGVLVNDAGGKKWREQGGRMPGQFVRGKGKRKKKRRRGGGGERKGKEGGIMGCQGGDIRTTRGLPAELEAATSLNTHTAPAPRSGDGPGWQAAQ